MYRAVATGILALHLAWILWVIFGCLVTGRRRLLAWFHIFSLVYSIIIELGLWPCPLTSAEQWAQSRAGIVPYQGGFLIHYLEAAIYPDVPAQLLVVAAVSLCTANLVVYGLRWRREFGQRRK